jgi:hypothetical protein
VALVMCFLQAGAQRLARGGVPQHAWRRFGNGPVAVRLPTVLAGGTPALAPRCLTAVHPAAISREVLPAGAAVDAVHGSAPPGAQTLAQAGPRGPPRQGRGLGGRGGVAARAGAVVTPRSSRGEGRQRARTGLGHGGLGNARGAPRAVGLRGDVLAHLGPVVVRRGMWPRGQACRPLAPPVGTASAHGPGGALLGRLDSGLGAQAAAPQGSHRVGSARVVCGLAPLEGGPRAGRPQDAGKARVRPQVGEPGPR